jgi:hypothetical protein
MYTTFPPAVSVKIVNNSIRTSFNEQEKYFFLLSLEIFMLTTFRRAFEKEILGFNKMFIKN